MEHGEGAAQGGASGLSTKALLRARVDGEVRSDAGSRGAYSTDGSNYVEPGIVLDELDRQLSDVWLTFGPKPSTHSHCSLGGMIGNNSCGAPAQAYGKTVDNVRRLSGSAGRPRFESSRRCSIRIIG
ncbi:FAD-binding oxidoreductase [Streptomyces sp. NPDC048516]|uniref:FAD-binding oxidoreductase n=1 Tax=Streptomyces sp. NPDC048516 TaxID=3365565 RepID=UPI00371D8AB7